MVGEWIRIWEESEYKYQDACGFVPFMVSYIHEDRKMHPAMLVVPGGGYRFVAASESHLPAMEFYREDYNVFVLVYTVNPLDSPLELQPLNDISRAVRMIRKDAAAYRIDPERIAVCGFSAGAHLCGSLCVHYKDVSDKDSEYDGYSNRPDAAILSYPVITSGASAHEDSFRALFGKKAVKEKLEYMSLEKHVSADTPPCFIWQTAEDQTVPVENSYLFAQACRAAGVPFAHHVFQEGVHGMSVATEAWLERELGDYYAVEQIRCLAAAVLAGETEYEEELGKNLQDNFLCPGGKKEKWMPDQKEAVREALPEVSLWKKLAFGWLERNWKILRENRQKNKTEETEKETVS